MNASQILVVADEVTVAEQQTKRLRRIHSVLSQVNQLIVRLTSREELLQAICRSVVECGEFELAWIGWLDRVTRAVRPIAQWGNEHGYLSRTTMHAQAGATVCKGSPSVANDLAQHQPVPWQETAARCGFRSAAAFPIHVRGETCGALNVHAVEPDVFQEEEIRLLADVAMVVSFALEKLEMESQRQRTEELLQQAKEAAEAANRAKSEFLANMSHEIRTPLTAILGYADVMLDNPTDDDARDAAETIKRNGDHLLQVVSDILDLAKIEAGRLDPTFCRCSPHQAVAEVVSMMRIRTDAKGLQLAVEYEGDIPQTIRTDPLRLRQILINLMGNAIKFTEVGGIRIVVRLADDSGDEPKLRFDVVDTGIGLETEQIPNLFQAFAQIDESARRRATGSGLGLVISKRLAGLLGGDLTVSSTPGKGSTFSATIAIGTFDAAETSVPSCDVPVRAARKSLADLKLGCRILMAEDGPDNQRVLSLLLRKAGAEVTVAENGAVAVEVALTAQKEGQPFDVVLMDIQMPVMDGYEATARLRQHGFTTPIIALTAHAMPDDRRKCLNAGCDDYLSKPVSPKELVRRIGTHLGSPSLGPSLG